jgi:hypothetical protein
MDVQGEKTMNLVNKVDELIFSDKGMTAIMLFLGLMSFYSLGMLAALYFDYQITYPFDIISLVCGTTTLLFGGYLAWRTRLGS